MKKIDSSDFKSMVEKAINSGKDSISFQIYGYNNQWLTVCRNTCAKLLIMLTVLKLILRVNEMTKFKVEIVKRNGRPVGVRIITLALQDEPERMNWFSASYQ